MAGVERSLFILARVPANEFRSYNSALTCERMPCRS